MAPVVGIEPTSMLINSQPHSPWLLHRNIGAGGRNWTSVWCAQGTRCTTLLHPHWWNIRESDSFTISLQGKPATHSYTPWWKQYESNIRRFLRTALQAAATNQQLPYFQLTLIIEGLFRASRRNLLRELWELSKKAYSACPLWRLNGARVLAYELYWYVDCVICSILALSFSFILYITTRSFYSVSIHPYSLK